MSNAASQLCVIRGCSCSAAGIAIRSPQSLCARHLAQELEKVREFRSNVQQSLPALIERAKSLRIEQQRLAVELQDVEELFDEAIESLVKCKETVIRNLNERHGSVLQDIDQISVLREYDAVVVAAEQTNNFRKVFELTSEMELNCEDLKERLNMKVDGSFAEAEAKRDVGDVSGGVRDLQVLMDRQMKIMLQLCQSAVLPKGSHKFCKRLHKIELHNMKDVSAEPVWVTSCNNTSGFMGDSNGRVVKSVSAGVDCVQMPERCVFVSFGVHHKVDHLLVLSVDGSVMLRCHCEIDWKSFVSGLYCDSKRQQLYVSQFRSVTVTDLSGDVIRILDANSLGQSVGRFGGIDGNSDKVFVLDHDEKKVLGIGKDSAEVQTVIDVNGFCGDYRFASGIAVHGNKIILTDLSNRMLHKVCMATKQLLASFSIQGEKAGSALSPVDVASDGRIIITCSSASEFRILHNDGSVLKVVNVNNGIRSHLYGLTVCEGEPQLLVLIGTKQLCVSVFHLL